VGENLLDHRRVFDAGNDLHRPAAPITSFDVDLEDTLQALCPGYDRLSHGGCPVCFLAPFDYAKCAGGAAPGTTCARRWLFGAKTPWNLVRFTRGLGTRAAKARDDVHGCTHAAGAGIRRSGEVQGLEADVSSAVAVRGL